MLRLQAFSSSSSNSRSRRRRSAAVSPAAALLLLRGVSISGSNAVAAEFNATANGNNSTSAATTPSLLGTVTPMSSMPTPLPTTNSTIQILSPTPLPTTTTIQPTAKPTRLQIKKVGKDGSPPEFFPLGLCQGDCANDDECAGDLICYQRGRNQAVPGCAGGRKESDRTDFCILPPTASPTISAAPSHQPSVSIAPSVSHAPSDQPSLSPTAKPTRLQIERVGKDGSPSEVFPLGLCQGDCDNDDECAGDLICYQRGRNDAVPGCAGGRKERDRTDFCILPPTASPTVSHPPSHQPSISAAPSVSFAPSDLPSFSPTQSPTMERSRPVRLRLHWTRNSRWQETGRETKWCLQCRSGSCRKNSKIEVDWCRSSKRQKFQYYERDRTFRPMINPSVCFEANGWDSQWRPIKLKRCNGSSRQKWKGFREKRGRPFEFRSVKNSNYCMTQAHHPRAHEKVFPQQCRRARDHKTSQWVVY